MRCYDVHYRMFFADKERRIVVLAKNAAEAYDKAVYEEIPKTEDGSYSYSAYVYGYTAQNGNYHHLNTSEDIPY